MWNSKAKPKIPSLFAWQWLVIKLFFSLRRRRHSEDVGWCIEFILAGLNHRNEHVLHSDRAASSLRSRASLKAYTKEEEKEEEEEEKEEEEKEEEEKGEWANEEEEITSDWGWRRARRKIVDEAHSASEFFNNEPRNGFVLEVY